MPAHSNARSRTWTRRTALPAQAPGGQRSGASCSARLPAPPLAREQLTSRLDSCRTTCSPLTRYAVPRRRGQDVLTGELHVVDQRRFVEAVRRPARRHLVLPRPRRRLDPRRTKTPHRRMALPRLVIRFPAGVARCTAAPADQRAVCRVDINLTREGVKCPACVLKLCPAKRFAIHFSLVTTSVVTNAADLAPIAAFGRNWR
jgi:hypothetical protein